MLRKASLKFQPIKRPQAQQKQAKTKSTGVSSSSSTHKFSSSTTAISASSPEKQILTSTPAQQQQPSVQKTNYEDWVGDEDDEAFHYQQDNRPRGGRKAKKKKNNKPHERVWDWDDIYDPTLPNNYADYKGSEEQNREIRDWKARLYYHQLKEAKKAEKNGGAYSDEEEGRKARSMNCACTLIEDRITADTSEAMFAPPPPLSFAPPSFDAAPAQIPVDDDDDYYPPQRMNPEPLRPHEPPPSFSQSTGVDDPTGEDAYMRRMRLSGMAAAPSASPPIEPTKTVAMPPPPPAAKPDEADVEAKRAEAQAKIAAFKAKLMKKAPKAEPAPSDVPPPPPVAATIAQPSIASQSPISPSVQQPLSPPPPPPQQPGGIISRAPVRYQLPPPPPDQPVDEDTPMNDAEDAIQAEAPPKNNRPGQKGFAQRLLQKYGWEKGQGLGATGEGITTAIVAKAEKRKKLPDAAGGGWAAPANMGKIVGGKKRKVDDPASSESDARFGAMSEVVKLTSMLDGLDVRKEIEENNLMQEVGEEMGEKYGNVERVFVWREEMGGNGEVFVKFTSQLSALRCINAMEGVSFAGNEVRAMFWDGEKFERGEYA